MYGQFLVLFALMLTGYVCRRTGIVDDPMNRGLNRFILYLAFPCLIIHKIGNLEMSGPLVVEFFLTFLISGATFAAFGLYSYIYSRARKFPREISNTAELAMATPNNGFMGFPVALIFFGERGLFFMLAHNTAMNLFLFSYGMHLMKRNHENRKGYSLKRSFKALGQMLFNPNILALIIGFFLCLLHIPIPEPINDYLNYLGSVATPMAMVFIGSTLAGSNLLLIVKNRIALETALNKNLVLPVLTYLMVAFLPVSPLMKAVVILGCLLPTAAMVAMLARENGQDSRLASEILFLSTVLSIVSLPVGIHLIHAFVI